MDGRGHIRNGGVPVDPGLLPKKDNNNTCGIDGSKEAATTEGLL